MVGKILSINISRNKGEKKSPVQDVNLIEAYGLEGDAHSGSKERQVSLLLKEDIEIMRQKGLEISYGDFAENLTVDNLRFEDFQIGSIIKIADSLLAVSVIGKICHTRCNIFKQVGYCVMPERGIFLRVLRGGKIRVGDLVEIVENGIQSKESE